jgi:hypothetical protein
VKYARFLKIQIDNLLDNRDLSVPRLALKSKIGFQRMPLWLLRGGLFLLNG